MWKLKCVNNKEIINEKIIKFKNIIGKDEIRHFFAINGYATMTDQINDIMDMKNGEELKFYFPNNTKYIEVKRISN